MEKEIRSFGSVPTATQDRIITGYALKFNQLSNLLESGGYMFREKILPQALTQEFVNSQDVTCNFNHDDDNGLLARSNKGKGTLKLTVDSVGLRYEFKAKNTALSEEVYQSVLCGDLFGSSFAFSVADGGDKWERQSDGTYIRTISKFQRLSDVSPVVRPAYQSSTVTARSIGKTEDLRSYYADLERRVKNAKCNPGEQYFQNLKNEIPKY